MEGMEEEGSGGLELYNVLLNVQQDKVMENWILI